MCQPFGVYFMMDPGTDVRRLSNMYGASRPAVLGLLPVGAGFVSASLQWMGLRFVRDALNHKPQTLT